MWLELIELMLADQRRAAAIKKATNFVNVKANVAESARNRRCSQKDSDQRDRDCFLPNDVQNDVFVNFQNCIHGGGGGGLEKKKSGSFGIKSVRCCLYSLG